MLDLSYNRLTVFSDTVLQGSTALTTLFLQGNKLTSLSPIFLPSGALLKILRLDKNPWSCDCRLLHLQSLPVTLALSLPCPTFLRCSPTVEVARIDGSSTLQCNTSAWPRPQPVWKMEGEVISSATETEDTWSMPRLVLSTITVSEPGEYSCQVGEHLDTIILEDDLSTNSASLSMVMGVAAGTTTLVLLLVLLALLCLMFRRQPNFLKSRRKMYNPAHTSSLAGLEYLSTSRTNPVAKPPRTFGQCTASPERRARTSLLLPPALDRGSSFPPQNFGPCLSNSPGCRTSIGTVSSFYPASIYFEPATLYHPSLTSTPLGLRSSADGSSLASLPR